jgi:two-component system phosphate regulon sensor histidine kinase PhoR
VMQRHGGSLAISSVLGQGSSFRLLFPAARWRV